MSQSVTSTNPQYDLALPDWLQMRDTATSQRRVKQAGFKYLPPTSGMVEDGIENTEQRGFKAYSAYRVRARFPGFVTEAVETALGVMHHKPPTIELPSLLEPMRDRATLRNESLEALLRRINEEQLIMGRIGMLLEVAEASPADLPLYIATYQAERITNWDEGTRDITELDSLNLAILNETEDERQPGGFDWELVRKYRVLFLGEIDANEQEGAYSVATTRDEDSFDVTRAIQPALFGQTLNFIPFVFCNTKDVVPSVDEPPLLSLSDLALTAYRGEADYRQSLFLQGQDTFVIVGSQYGKAPDSNEPVRVGAGSTLHLTAGSSATYEGVDSSGLTEQREALQNDYQRGEGAARGIEESVSRAAESGEALRVRVAARTASLNQIALTGAFALEMILKMAAIWRGANPDDVRVVPNLDFVGDKLKGRELLELQTAKNTGAPLAQQSIHEIEQERGLTSMTFEEEIEQMKREAELGIPGAMPVGEETPPGGSTNPDGPVEEELEEEEDPAEDERETEGATT